MGLLPLPAERQWGEWGWKSLSGIPATRAEDAETKNSDGSARENHGEKESERDDTKEEKSAGKDSEKREEEEKRTSGGCRLVVYSSFNRSADAYFTRVEACRVARAAARQREAYQQRIDAVRRDSEERVKKLETQIHNDEMRATAILCHQQLCDAALREINGALAAGEDWETLKENVSAMKRETPLHNFSSIEELNALPHAIDDLRLKEGIVCKDKFIAL